MKTVKERYDAAVHAVQSAIAFMMNYGYKGTEPKHLRVGIHSALVNDAALADILIKKGIITQEEYAESVMEWMEKEVEDLTQYAKKLSKLDNISFG